MELIMRDKEMPHVWEAVSEDDATWLMEQLESAEADAADFYLARETVALLESAGASATLLASLQQLVADRGEADVELLHQLADGTLARIVLRPHDAALPAKVGEETDHPARVLTCVVCGGGEFEHRRAKMSELGGVLDFSWFASRAECYICRSCGYVHWFVR